MWQAHLLRRSSERTTLMTPGGEALGMIFCADLLPGGGGGVGGAGLAPGLPAIAVDGGLSSPAI